MDDDKRVNALLGGPGSGQLRVGKWEELLKALRLRSPRMTGWSAGLGTHK